jgi:hypothetical protein
VSWSLFGLKLVWADSCLALKEVGFIFVDLRVPWFVCYELLY